MDANGEAGKNDDNVMTATANGNATADRKEEATKENIKEEEMKEKDWNYAYGEMKEEEEVKEVKEEMNEEDWNNVEEKDWNNKDGEVDVEEDVNKDDVFRQW